MLVLGSSENAGQCTFALCMRLKTPQIQTLTFDIQCSYVGNVGGAGGGGGVGWRINVGRKRSRCRCSESDAS